MYLETLVLTPNLHASSEEKSLAQLCQSLVSANPEWKSKEAACGRIQKAERLGYIVTYPHQRVGGTVKLSDKGKGLLRQHGLLGVA